MGKIFFLIAYVCLFFVTCSKEGPMGPEGEQGEQGIAGIDGTSLLSGNGIPGSSIGKNGDFYLDKINLNLYGPKTSTGWGEGISIKGKDGQDGKDGKDGKDGINGKDAINGKDGKDGKDGSKILSGTSIPTLELGNIGDFYFDIQNLTIYGPKTSAGWGAPVSLKVPNGSEVTILMYRNHSFQKITKDDGGWIPTPNSYSLESTIQIDSRYQDAYDNGIVMVQFRRSGGNWTTHIYLVDQDPISGTITKIMEIYLKDHDGNGGSENEISIKKDRIKLYGYTEGYTQPEIEAFKIDIKMIFIPAAKVIEMSAKNVDINNPNTISNYLGLN